MLNYEIIKQSQYDEKNQIQLCWSFDKNTCWLELQNIKWIIDQQHDRPPSFVKVYIGGYFHSVNKIWVNIDGGTARNLKADMIGLSLDDKDKVARFQHAICKSWNKLNTITVNPSNALNYLDEIKNKPLIELNRELVKGTSISKLGFEKELTSPAFLLKALKTGFQEINAESGGLGLFSGSYHLDDVKKYFQSSTAKAKGTVNSESFGLEGFNTIPESLLSKIKQDPLPRLGKDNRIIQPILSTRTHLHPAGELLPTPVGYAYDSDLTEIPWPRVDAYCFRGDSRGPTAIRIATGFLPNATRDDQIKQYEDVIKWIKKFEKTIDSKKSNSSLTYTKHQCIFGWSRSIGKIPDSVPNERIPFNYVETAASQINNLIKLNFLIEEGNKINHDYASKELTIMDAFNEDKIIRVVTDEDRVASGSPIDLRSYQKTQILGAYVSLSKSVSIARHFASGRGGTVVKGKYNNGWVYACRAYGGFNLPINTQDHKNRFPHALNWLKGVPYSEQEIALPGLIDWEEDIVAIRRVNENGDLVGDLYIKQNLEEREGKQLHDQIFQLLEGATQGTY